MFGNHFCGIIMSICVCVCVCIYIYIYIYIWIDVYVWVPVCVCSWMGGQRGDLISGIFEAVLECPEDLSWSTLERRPHRELCLQKPARPGEKNEESESVKGKTHSGQLGAEKHSVRSRGSDKAKIRSEPLKHGVKTEQWRRWPDESAFLVAV